MAFLYHFKPMISLTILLGKFFFHMLFCGRSFAIFPVSHAPKRWLGPLARAEDWCAEVTANIVRPVFGEISVIVQDDFCVFFFLPVQHRLRFA